MWLLYKDSQTMKCHLQKWSVVMLQQLRFTKNAFVLVEWTFSIQHWQEVKQEVTISMLYHQSDKNSLKKVEIPVTALTPSLEQPLCLLLHDFPDSEFDGLIHVKVLTETVGALAHTFLNFVHVQCFCLDCRLSSPPRDSMCVCVWSCHLP